MLSNTIVIILTSSLISSKHHNLDRPTIGGVLKYRRDNGILKVARFKGKLRNKLSFNAAAERAAERRQPSRDAQAIDENEVDDPEDYHMTLTETRTVRRM